jgi:hypothetical protein
MRGEGGDAGSQSMSKAVHRGSNKIWRSNSIFNLCFGKLKISDAGEEREMNS